MSGHSKWAQIKRKKEVTDRKRGQVFSKLLKSISAAAKTEPNPQFNPTLRSAIEKAKESNVPQENIERAIHKSSEERSEELIMEAYGPGGIPIRIIALTDNKNRTVSEVKKILSDNACKWADPGSVLWAFTRSKEGEWEPNFPQTIPDDAKEILIRAFEALDDQADVMDIHSSAILDS